MQANRWSAWTPVADSVAAAPGSPVTATVIDLFVTGTDKQVHTAAWNGTAYVNWMAIPGVEAELQSPITFVHPYLKGNKCDVDRVFVFVVGSDRQVHTASRDADGHWTNWAPLPGTSASLASEVSAVSRIEGEIDLAITDSRGGIVFNSWSDAVASGTWSGWSSLNGGSTKPETKVAAAARNERVEIFVTNGGGEVDFTSRGADGWLNWSLLHTGTVAPRSPVTALSVESTRMDVFVADPQGMVSWIYYLNGWYDGWQHVGDKHGVPRAPITAVSHTKDDMTLLLPGDDGGVYTIQWGGSAVGWEPSWHQVRGVEVGERSQIGAVARDDNTIAAFVVTARESISSAVGAI